jgi:hypothetical protein
LFFVFKITNGHFWNVSSENVYGFMVLNNMFNSMKRKFWSIVVGSLLVGQASVSAQIKVEAESFVNSHSLATDIIFENDNKSVGYFDEKGEYMEYEVEIPQDGLYQFSFKYLAGKPGSLLIEDAAGASFVYETEANNTSGSWWELPMNSWPEYETSKGALFYFEKGTQTFFVKNRGTGLNLDYFTLTKSSSSDKEVVKIKTNPSKVELMPKESFEILANGVNASGEMVAQKIVWSNNAPEGVYTAGNSLGSDVVTATIGSVVKEIKVSICKPEKKQEFVVSKHGQLSVKGGSVCDASGNVVSLMGPSFYWSCSSALWWTKETVDYLVSKFNVQIIRLPVSIAPSEGSPWNGDPTWNEDNYYHRPDYCKKLVDEMVKAAIENDIYVIIDFHEHHAEHWVDMSKEFFTYFAEKWGEYPNVMYEIYNEPMTDNGTVVNYAKQIIPVLRAIDQKNIIIVGSTQYSREPHNVTAAGQGYSNIAYTWHGYVEWGHQSDWNSNSSWTTSVPIVVTEWGLDWSKNDGGLLQVYKNKSLINCFWSMGNKGGDDGKWSILNSDCYKTTNWSDAEMTENGAYLLGVAKNWVNYTPKLLEVSREFRLSICSGKTLMMPVDKITLTGEATGGTEQYQYAWKQISGPSGAVIASPNSATTTVSGLSEGTYVFSLSATDGEEELEESVKFVILPEGYVDPSVIDDFEDGNYVSKIGGEWGVFDDRSKNANPHSNVNITAADGALKVDYQMGNQWHGDGWMGAPYCGFEMYLKALKDTMDLSLCSKITYRYKGDAHEFRAETEGVKDEDYHSVRISASDSWTTASISWSSLQQAPDWGDEVAMDQSAIVKFSWQFKSEANKSGSLEIDDVACEGISFPTGSIDLKRELSMPKFFLAPNPSADGISYIIVDEVSDVVVMDVMGRVVKEFKAVPNVDNEICLNRQGVYFVKVGEHVEKLIVK